GAIVQIQGKPEQVQTDKQGAYTFTGLSGTQPLILTAWSSGHYVGWTNVNPSAANWPGGDKLNITLKTLPQKDNPQYEWFKFEGVEGSASCGVCHREYKEWQLDAHAQAAVNPRFLTLYTGTDVHGNEGQPVQYGSNGLPLPYDPHKPYFGPGLKRDTP